MKKKRIIFIILTLVFVITSAYLIINNLGRRGLASLEVNSNTVMDVIINGKRVGVTPYTGTYPPNEVTVQIGNYQTRVQLQNGIKTVLNREFSEDKTQSSGELVSFQDYVKGTTTIAIISDPGGAQVSIDGIMKGITPLNVEGLTPGTHQLMVSAPQYDQTSFPINVVSSYKLIASIDLMPVVTEVKQETNLTQELKTVVRILDTPNGFLRVRKDPSTSSDEIGQVKPQETYPLLSTDSKTGWFNIQLATISGWVSNIYAATESASP